MSDAALALERGDQRNVLLKGRWRGALLRLNEWMTAEHANRVILASGVTRFGPTLSAARSLSIALPSLAEQKAIAMLMAGVDEATEKAQEENSHFNRSRHPLPMHC